MKVALLITGLFDGRGSVECLDLIHSNLVIPNNFDVFIYTELLSFEHEKIVKSWPSLIDFDNSVNTDEIKPFFLNKTDFMFGIIDKQVNDESQTSKMYHRKGILSVVDQHIRMIDGCERMRKYMDTHNISYDYVLRWRLDFMPMHVMRVPVDTLADRVWVLRLQYHESDRVHEFLCAKWQHFYDIYTTFIHWYLHYWPMNFFWGMSLIETQFGQHLRQFPYTYMEQRIKFDLYVSMRHYKITFVDNMKPMQLSTFTSAQSMISLRHDNSLHLDRTIHTNKFQLDRTYFDHVNDNNVQNVEVPTTTYVEDYTYFVLFITTLTLTVVCWFMIVNKWRRHSSLTGYGRRL